MTRRWGAALGAVAALVCVGAAAGAADRTACELRGADRARTGSQGCMACHDGTTGASVGFVSRAGGLGVSHPVGVDYAAAAARQPGRYAPAADLPPDVPLVSGKVECTTCHDGASSAPDHVARTTVTSLCTACHRL